MVQKISETIKAPSITRFIRNLFRKVLNKEGISQPANCTKTRTDIVTLLEIRSDSAIMETPKVDSSDKIINDKSESDPKEERTLVPKDRNDINHIENPSSEVIQSSDDETSKGVLENKDDTEHFKQTEETRVRPYVKKLRYTDSFKSFIRNNPLIIKDFFKARKELINQEKRTENKVGNLTLKKIEKGGYAHTYAWEAQVGGKTFFIKEQEAEKEGGSFRDEWDSPEPQISSLKSASQLLETDPQTQEYVRKIILSTRAEKIEIANWHFGYSKKNTEDFENEKTDYLLITDFYEGKQLAKEKVPQQILELIRHLYKKGLDDVNILWCPKEKKFVIFDLRPRN